MNHPKNIPPSEWLSGRVTQIADTLYFQRQDDPFCLTSWHWCSQNERWQAEPVQYASIQQKQPLSLESPLLFLCCGLHGRVHNGQWEAE
ncbi:hypothetical protein SUDANB145_07210 (plasmid) [Streptomyces sp. enrichment culture]